MRGSAITTIDIETPHGPARAHLRRRRPARGALILGHGAGGGVGAPDLVAAADAAHDERLSVALVEQPYRVAGRRSPPPAGQLDAAWTAVVARLAARELRGLPLVVGGRSSGARVACRTADATGAIAVLCLAFPLHAPTRAGGTPRPTRLPELDAVPVPALVVQGRNDPFGLPPSSALRSVVVVDGTHSLKADVGAVFDAVATWLRGVIV